MLLIDTNIFLEIILGQKKKETCKRILSENKGHLYISDFSLHSIGIILFRNSKGDLFSKFIADVLPLVKLVKLSKEGYMQLIKVSEKYNLDFDDSYQTSVALEYKLKIITMDFDFRKIEKIIDVIFL